MFQNISAKQHECGQSNMNYTAQHTQSFNSRSEGNLKCNQTMQTIQHNQTFFFYQIKKCIYFSLPYLDETDFHLVRWVLSVWLDLVMANAQTKLKQSREDTRDRSEVTQEKLLRWDVTLLQQSHVTLEPQVRTQTLRLSESHPHVSVSTFNNS